jgi:hypothetical protein
MGNPVEYHGRIWPISQIFFIFYVYYQIKQTFKKIIGKGYSRRKSRSESAYPSCFFRFLCLYVIPSL